MDTFDDVNFVDYNWSKRVRKNIINVNSNIEIKVASFVTDMSISQLNKHQLVIGIAYVGASSTIKKHLVTIALSGKSFAALSVGSSGTMYSYHIHNEHYIGDDADAKAAILWQVGAKFETTKSHVLLDTLFNDAGPDSNLLISTGGVKTLTIYKKEKKEEIFTCEYFWCDHNYHLVIISSNNIFNW